ncbi:MAG: DUF2934 domain-containing protein [Chloroflexi bacterium]|nr:DUF2934 domain-containing protein [Chloroflexota bacterium]
MEREEEVRRIAFDLWQQEGRPEGRALEHWLKAQKVMEESRPAEAAVQAAPSAPASPQPAMKGAPRRRGKRV